LQAPEGATSVTADSGRIVVQGMPAFQYRTRLYFLFQFPNLDEQISIEAGLSVSIKGFSLDQVLELE